MSIAALATVLFASVAMFSQEVNPASKATSDLVLAKFCGRIQWGTTKPGKDGYEDTHTKGLHGVRLQLYRREAGRQCCASQDLVTSAKTGIGGRFNFYRSLDGSYWLVAEYQGQTYSLPLDVRRSPKSETLCADQQFVIWSDGRFDMQRYVVVD